MNLKSQKGSSIIASLLGIAIIVGLTVMISRTSVNISKAKKLLSITDSMTDSNQLLYSSILEQFATSIKTDSCPLPSALFDNFEFDEGSSLNLANDLSYSSKVPAFYREAVDRCRVGSKSPQDPADAAEDSWYFCLNFSVDPGNDNTYKFLQSSQAFMEIRVFMTDLQSDAGISCQEFASLPSTSAGLKMFFSIYWTKKLGKKTYFKRRNGTYILKN